jgi:6-phosphogluconolactonase
MANLDVTILPNAQDVATSVVAELIDLIGERSATGADVHISLTGGTVGNQIARALLSNETVRNCRSLHLWWSDERYVPVGHEDRNDLVLQDLIAGCLAKVHAVAGPDTTDSVQAAAKAYAHDLHLATTTRFCATNTLMDVCVLGMGPDGHIASLFPGSSTLEATEGVVAVSNSPKPPPVRVTWTYSTINASEQVWLVVTGASKASAAAQLQAGAPIEEIPAAGVQGKQVTRLIVDADAYNTDI